MDLCGTRQSLPGNPSTCLLDTVLVPLPSLLLIFGSLVLSIIITRNEPTPKQESLYVQHPVLSRCLRWFFRFLLLAAVGLAILEMVRLIVAGTGIGLLPAHVVGLIFALLSAFRPRFYSSAMLVFYWLFLISVVAVKVVRLNQLNNLFPNSSPKYPPYDWLLDTAVSLGLYVIFFFVQSWELFRLRRMNQAPNVDF